MNWIVPYDEMLKLCKHVHLHLISCHLEALGAWLITDSNLAIYKYLFDFFSCINSSIIGDIQKKTRVMNICFLWNDIAWFRMDVTISFFCIFLSIVLLT